MRTEKTEKKIQNMIKAGGIFLICLSAFVVFLFFVDRYYKNRRMIRAEGAGEGIESNISEYIDAGMYCTDMLEIICSEFGMRSKDKITTACDTFMASEDDVLRMAMIYNGEKLEYLYPESYNPLMVKDLLEDSVELTEAARYSLENDNRAISDTFSLLSGEEVLGIVQAFEVPAEYAPQNRGTICYAVVILDINALLEDSGIYSLNGEGYYYRLYRTNPVTGLPEDLASFGENYITAPVTVDKVMPNGETWHLELQLNAGWIAMAERASFLLIAFTIAFLIAFVFLLFMNLKSREEELKLLSYSDPLTKVKNSRAYTDSLEELKESDEKYGIIYVDVNDFKKINDTYGHRTGDEILHITAERVANTIRQGDYVYRIGGDEFAVLIHGEHDKGFFEGIIRRMKDAMNRKVTVLGNSLNVSISCGFARYPEDGTDYNSVIQVADSEMYRDKAAQKSGELGGSYWLDHDVMTGLYNRDGFYKAVSLHLKEHNISRHVMVSTDVKSFKMINQLYGTGKGNEILVKEARLLEMEYGNSGVICGRIHGDHFAMLIDKDDYDEDYLSVVLNDFAKNAVGDGYRMIVQAGVYDITEPDMSPAIMMDKTSMALKSVKDSDEFRIVHYTDEMMKDSLIENDVLTRFDKALKNNEFKMYLQPQVDKDGNLLGAEALARWVSDGKVVNPGEFIPVLEKTNQIYRLDEVIWEKAAKKLNEWKGTPLEKMTISVNISPKDIYYIDIEKNLRDLRTKYDLTPDKLKLEITETAVMLDRTDGSKLVDKLQEQGFEVEMDDFGSGYSSLNMLKDIKIDVLKIDMGFLNHTEDENRAAVIIDSVISMAKKLGMTVIAEGVESKKQLSSLAGMGCDIFQGFYFSKPVSPETFESAYGDIEELEG